MSETGSEQGESATAQDRRAPPAPSLRQLWASDPTWESCGREQQKSTSSPKLRILGLGTSGLRPHHQTKRPATPLLQRHTTTTQASPHIRCSSIYPPQNPNRLLLLLILKINLCDSGSTRYRCARVLQEIRLLVYTSAAVLCNWVPTNITNISPPTTTNSSSSFSAVVDRSIRYPSLSLFHHRIP